MLYLFHGQLAPEYLTWISWLWETPAGSILRNEIQKRMEENHHMRQLYEQWENHFQKHQKKAPQETPAVFVTVIPATSPSSHHLAHHIQQDNEETLKKRK